MAIRNLGKGNNLICKLYLKKFREVKKIFFIIVESDISFFNWFI